MIVGSRPQPHGGFRLNFLPLNFLFHLLKSLGPFHFHNGFEHTEAFFVLFTDFVNPFKRFPNLVRHNKLLNNLKIELANALKVTYIQIFFVFDRKWLLARLV